MLFHGLLLSIFLEYVRPGNFVPVISMIKIGTIVPLLVFVASLTKLEPVSNRQLFREPTTRWILAYLFLLVLSVFIAEVTLYSWTIFKFALGYVFWYIMLVKLVTDLGKLRKVFAVLIFSHILLLILNPAVVTDPATRSYLVAAPFLGDGNDFSLSVCVVLPFCLWLILTTKSKISRTVLIGSCLVLIFAIIGTQSRGATLALAAILGYLWWNGKHKLIGIALIAVVCAGILVFAPPEYFERMQTITHYQDEGSAMGRITAWKTGVRMALAYPLTGVGSGHFPVALGTEFRPPEFGDQNLPWLTAHSMYFLVIGELGFPGIVCFLGLLWHNYRRLARLRRESHDHLSPEQSREYELLFLMLSASLIGFCVGGAFLSVAYYPHVFVLSGINVAAGLMYKRATAGLQTEPKTVSGKLQSSVARGASRNKRQLNRA